MDAKNKGLQTSGKRIAEKACATVCRGLGCDEDIAKLKESGLPIEIQITVAWGHDRYGIRMSLDECRGQPLEIPPGCEIHDEAHWIDRGNPGRSATPKTAHNPAAS